MSVNVFHAELSWVRDEQLEKVKPFTPKWSGKPFKSWSKYPHLPDDAPIEVSNALGTIKIIDAIFRLVGGKRDTYTLSSQQMWKLWISLETLQTILLADGPYKQLLKAGTTRTLQLRKAAAVSNEAHADLRDRYQIEVDQAVASGMSYTVACEDVASKLGVSGRTVAKHTINRHPRNRGKWAGRNR